MKIVIAPDSFKGTLSAVQAAQAIEAGLRSVFPDAQLVLLPLADGGEGTTETLVSATHGRLVPREVSGPLGETLSASYGILGDGQTGVVETAAASGLTLVPAERRNPWVTTTYGTGELILAAAEAGMARLVIGLGGSATNDGGLGAMQALGVVFLDRDSTPLPPKASGGALSQVTAIDISNLRFPVGKIPITIASDVTNPLIGPQGASAVYGPQKGANPETVALLDAGLAHFATILHRDLGSEVATQPGAGAAGGLGAALLAFLGAQMHSGIDVMLHAVDFDGHACDADWIVTGEGSIDGQTLQGKAIAGVLAHGRRLGVHVLAFGGKVESDAQAHLAESGLHAAYSLVAEAGSPEEAMRHASYYLELAARRAAWDIQTSSKAL